MKIVICGGGGSGKDFLKKKMIERGFVPSVSYTSRPPRDGEIDGQDYFFVSNRIFDKMIGKDEFHEYEIFNRWCYGTLKDDFRLCNLFIMTPPAIEKLTPELRKELFVIYLDIPVSVRRERLSKRNDTDDVQRRLQADLEMFSKFTDFDLRITNENF